MDASACSFHRWPNCHIERPVERVVGVHVELRGGGLQRAAVWTEADKAGLVLSLAASPELVQREKEELVSRPSTANWQETPRNPQRGAGRGRFSLRGPFLTWPFKGLFDKSRLSTLVCADL